MAGARAVPGRVLFACSYNAVRSPMGAAILTHLSGSRISATSAGVRAGTTDPYMVAVMDEIGIDVSDHEPQKLASVADELFDVIITLSPEAHHHALELTRIMGVSVEYWRTKDATAKQDITREEKLACYREVRDGIFERIRERFSFQGGPTV